MKRLLLSIAVGILIIFVLSNLISALDYFVSSKYPDTFLVERVPLAWLLEWPMPVLRRLFPPDNGSRLRLSQAGVVLFILGNLTAYSVLTYAFLGWRGKRKHIYR